MSLTGYMCYHCTLDQAKFVAECADLRLVGVPYYWDKKDYPKWYDPENRPYYQHHNGHSNKGYWFWEDAKYSGGACRIVYFRGVAWVSSHSGYAHADITRDACQLFAELGADEVVDYGVATRNPMIYGVDEFLERNVCYQREGD